MTKFGSGYALTLKRWFFMQTTVSEIDIVQIVIFGAIILLALSFFIVVILLFFRQKQTAHLREKQALNEAYQREILQAQIETQNQTLQHLGEELHDHIGQLLAVAILQLNMLDEELEQTPYQASVQQTGSLMERVINDLRVLSKTLNTNALTRLGLHDSVALELERIRRTGRYQTRLTITGEPRPINPQVAIVVFRMVQEVISNTLKHANAKTILVNLEYPPDRFRVRVADDGKKLTVNGFSTEMPTVGGQGLTNLHRRTNLLGGICTMLSQPGEGCVVTIDLPLSTTS
jgi:signal transduction histidine kinase